MDFNPRTPCGVRRNGGLRDGLDRSFQSTPPVRGATLADIRAATGADISIHAPRAGCDASSSLIYSSASYFNPRTPCGVRRFRRWRLLAPPYFNPRTPCGVRRVQEAARQQEIDISIHAPRAGCDHAHHRAVGHAVISIHAPRAGCDVRRVWRVCFQNFNPRTPCGVRRALPLAPTADQVFQSTHPVRGATRHTERRRSWASFQSTHPVRGATLTRCGVSSSQNDFNPRTPCGVRRGRVGAALPGDHISIHAPRAGCDAPITRLDAVCRQFQSTHPVRGATSVMLTTRAALSFQSTHPVRGATLPCSPVSTPYVISIHAPRAGCDVFINIYAGYDDKFQSTHPVRGATRWRGTISANRNGFQSTHPVRGATAKERRKSIGLLSLFHKTSLPSGVLAQNPQTASRTERHFSVRSTRGIHVHFGFAPQIMSTPSGS